jgi:spore coat polysaccharide biosynthesis protein SpsF
VNVGVIVFSRMSSSRLPGKALRSMGSMPLVEWVMRRAAATGLKVVLATSTENEDDILANHVTSLGFSVYRGSLNSVLERGVLAAETFGFEYFFRLCGDRPFFDLDEMNRMIEILSQDAPQSFDLISTSSIDLPKGLTTELIKTAALKNILYQTNLNEEHQEHMTAYFYEYPEKFRMYVYAAPFKSKKDICLAVDTVEDYQKLSGICSLESDVLLDTFKAIAYLQK